MSSFKRAKRWASLCRALNMSPLASRLLWVLRQAVKPTSIGPRTLSWQLPALFRQALVGLAFGIALFGIPAPGSSTTIPTPAPGTASPLSAPSPNPVQYNPSAGQVIKSADYLSTWYKNYTDLGNVITALNSCSYAPGATITGVTATSPISASVGSCNPGTGATLTLSFSAVGQTLNVGALNSSGGLAGASGGVSGTWTAGTYTGGAFTGSSVSTSGNGQFGGSMNVSGQASFGSTVSNGAIQKYISGTSYGVPFDAQDTSGSVLVHYEHGDIAVTGTTSVGANSCLGPFNATFSTDTYSRGSKIFASATSVSTSGAAAQICNLTAGSITAPDYVSWFSLGE
jgi:hypothetical protein